MGYTTHRRLDAELCFVCVANIAGEKIEWAVGIPVYKVVPWMLDGERTGSVLYWAPDGSVNPDKLRLFRRADGSWFLDQVK